MKPHKEHLAQQHAARRRRFSRGWVWAMLPVFLISGILVFFVSLQRSLIYAAQKGDVPLSAAGPDQERISEIHVPSHDGLILHGWLSSTEQSQPGGPQRLVILFPGNAGNRSFRTSILRDFNSCGCNALICDYRGYAENSGSPSEEALASDARSIWEFAIDQLGYRPESIVLCGESLGGGVATRLAWDLKQTGISPAGLILRTTFTSLVDTGKKLFPWLPVRTFLIDRYPSIDRIGELTCPILIIHGRRDMIVPFEQGRRLFEAAPQYSSQGIEKRFLDLPYSGHNDLQMTAAQQVHAAHATFLSQIFSSVTEESPLTGD